MAVPPEMEIRFDSLATIAGNHPKYVSDPRRSILITGDVNTMRQLACKVPEVKKVNLGGLHHRAGRAQKLRYVFLTPQEEQELRDLEHTGVEVTAQDVPSARVHPLSDVLSGEAKS
jgi:PTS system mannose-specific IIB component/fructoselysine and glucoselysine-specific PTS system IIB component